MGTGRARRAAIGMVGLLGLVGTSLVAPAAFGAESLNQPSGPVGPAVVEACRDTVGAPPAVGDRACRNIEQGGRLQSQLCRLAGGPEAVCSQFDGRDLSPEQVDTFENSPLAGALALQRALESTAPLSLGLTPGTHNSFNSAAYPPTLSGFDHNQVLSMRDQLRLGMRSLEMDVHWFPSPHADPAHGGRAPILCHGQSESGGGPVTIHVGCTGERHLRDGLAELAEWLFEPANHDELVILYLENQLDSDPVAHQAAADTIVTELGGDLITPHEPCEPLPVDRSPAELLERGRVIIVGNCDGAFAGWSGLVHERFDPTEPGGNWNESKSGPGSDDHAPAPTCADRTDHHDTTLIRVYEDSTWLADMVDGSGLGGPGDLTAGETAALVACGVNLFGFDQLTADDPRLAALLWSWAPDEPAATVGPAAARRGADGRFHAADPSEPRPFACVDGAGAWHVTATVGAWSAGDGACTAADATWRFSVPTTGWDNTRLGVAAAAAGASSIWLDYADPGTGWTPDP